AVRDVVDWASHALWSRLRARRSAVGARARTTRRRRVESDRAWEELRMAARLVRDQLRRHADSQSRHAPRPGEAGDLLDAGDRTREHDGLSGQDVSAVERVAAHRRFGDAIAQPR